MHLHVMLEFAFAFSVCVSHSRVALAFRIHLLHLHFAFTCCICFSAAICCVCIPHMLIMLASRSPVCSCLMHFAGCTCHFSFALGACVLCSPTAIASRVCVPHVRVASLSPSFRHFYAHALCASFACFDRVAHCTPTVKVSHPLVLRAECNLPP
jgi:hypothetical protein